MHKPCVKLVHKVGKSCAQVAGLCPQSTASSKTTHYQNAFLHNVATSYRHLVSLCAQAKLPNISLLISKLYSFPPMPIITINI